MSTLDPSLQRNLPDASRSRLTHARLRQPTALPNLLATTMVGRCINRLRCLFGAR